MATPPTCLSIIICETVLEDIRSRNKTIINTFNQVNSRAYPMVLPRMTLFATYTNGRGQQDTKLEILPDGNDAPLASLKGAIHFEDPLKVVDVTIDLINVLIPVPGWYTFQLSCGAGLTQRRLQAILVPQGA